MITKVYELAKRERVIILEKMNVKKFIRDLNIKGKLPNLTKDQRQSIKALYKKYNISLNPDYDNYQLLYSANGEFSKTFIPNDLFRSMIEPSLNYQRFKIAWADKNMIDRMLPMEFTARTIVHNMNGLYFDSLYNPISSDKALNMLKAEKDYVIKKAIGTASGKGVIHVTNPVELNEALEMMDGSNFIAQERIVPHSLLREFNDTSVSIVRIISLRLKNQEPVILSGTLRVGPKGSFTDNYIDENHQGMTVIGVSMSGDLMEKAYFASGERNFQFENDFKNKRIPCYKEMCKVVLELHKKLPYFGLVGWDVTVNDEAQIKILEYNINAIGIVYYQYIHGPLFGQYTEAVLDQVFKTHKH